MKKIIIALCTVLFCTINTMAYDIMIDGIAYNYNADSTSVIVTYTQLDETNYNGTTKVILPEMVAIDGTNYDVSEIGDFAFYDSKIESISINSNISKIGDRALAHCPNLSSIDVDINSNYFDGEEACNAIIDLNTRTLIAGCSNTVIPWSVDAIGPFAFSGCSALQSITIPGTVVSIGYEAFEGTGIENITIPAGIIDICYRVFANCNSLSSIVVDNHNRRYDSRSDCNAVIETATGKIVAACKNTTFPSDVNTIGYEGFSGIAGINKLVIPQTITTIGHYAFRESPELNVVDIAGSVNYFGDRAFENCTGLEKVFARLTYPQNAEYGNCETFKGVAVDTCWLIVNDDLVELYRATMPWSEFLYIKPLSEVDEGIIGDVTGDGVVDIDDVNAVINIILKVKTEDDYPGNANINNDDTVDVDDMNLIINIILNQNN